MLAMQKTELQELLLKNRGITEDEWDNFLNPNYEIGLNDPFLFRDMEKVVTRVLSAVENNEKIVVYSDYDADGVPGGVILHDFFKKIGYTNFENYIPHRHDEGYGLHLEAVEEFITLGVKLIITVDLGTTAVAETLRAKEGGIDIIITDHHLGQSELPEAYAILNPHLPGETYPFKELCGSGVAFKLVQALCARLEAIPLGWEKWLLDMVAIATLSDMVPLIGENRVLASYGLQVLRKSRRPGVQELFRKMKIDMTHLVEEDITFMLAPRLNAASRMDSPQAAFDVLSETDAVRARTLADHLTKINDSRKTLVATIMRDVHAKLEGRTIKEVIVIGHSSWRPGVLGLIASKIVETYKRPAFVWGAGEEEGTEVKVFKGSCRTYGGINVVELMTHATHSFASFGGHAEAGGFVVPHETVHFLEEHLVDAYNKVDRTTIVEAQTTYTVDTELPLGDVSIKTYTSLVPLTPFGLANAKPVFLFKDVLVQEVRQFGKTKEHLEIIVSDGKKIVKAISFFTTVETFSRPIQAGKPIDLVATFDMSYFMGRPELRLRIVDIL